jgi:hypothetical protein
MKVVLRSIDDIQGLKLSQSIERIVSNNRDAVIGQRPVQIKGRFSNENGTEKDWKNRRVAHVRHRRNGIAVQ